MYTRLVGSATVSSLRNQPLRRQYATRRIIKASSSTPILGPFQNMSQFQGQSVNSPASTVREGFEPGLFKNAASSPIPPFPLTAPFPPASEAQILQKSVAPGVSTVEQDTENPVTPLYHQGNKFDRVPYWQKIPRWKDVTEKEWLSYEWQVHKNVQGPRKLYEFLSEVLPENIPLSEKYQHIRTRDEFIYDVTQGIKEAPMSIRLTPHILSVINWDNPLEDPLRRQFIPMKSKFVQDHPKLKLDSLHETVDSPVPGLVHRYEHKVLFLATTACGLYCRFCTRSYAVGGDTETVTKTSLRGGRARWDAALAYIASNEDVHDVVVSGGDSYMLPPEHLRYIGDRLLAIPHVRRFRIATKGLCVSPSRTIDPNDTWTDEIIRLSNLGRLRGKQVALHTHFNHEQEFTWVTREASQKLFENGVIVRCQTVLLRGVNDTVQEMYNLIKTLADNNIESYYIYQGDEVKGVEDLRTPLSTILNLEREIRGSIAGFATPQFIVDLPGGGGKRLATSYESYDPITGVSRFKAPSVKGTGSRKGEKEGQIYEYWDPIAFTVKAVEKDIEALGVSLNGLETQIASLQP